MTGQLTTSVWTFHQEIKLISPLLFVVGMVLLFPDKRDSCLQIWWSTQGASSFSCSCFKATLPRIFKYILHLYIVYIVTSWSYFFVIKLVFTHQHNLPQSGDIPEEFVPSNIKSPFGTFEQPLPTQVPPPMLNPLHAALMLSPWGKNPLEFRGKNVDEFLVEFEYYAEHAQLTNTQKCKEIRMYFASHEKRVLEVLDSFKHMLWLQLKSELQSLYTSSNEKKDYCPKDLQKLISKERKISKLTHFDHHSQLIWRVYLDRPIAAKFWGLNRPKP